MLSELATILAELVDTDMGIRDALSDAGINSVHVNLQGSPFDMWRNALEYADTNNALPSIMSVMRGRYPQSSRLFDAELRYWTAQAVKPQSTMPAHFQKDMAHIQSTLAGLNVRLMYMERDGRERSDLLATLQAERGQDWVRMITAVVLASLGSSLVMALLQALVQTGQ